MCFAWALGSSAQGADAGLKDFEIAAGPAENSLKVFSLQSGLEVVFASSLVGEIKTQAVKGRYSVREALDLMLAKTGLIAEQDEKTGALIVASDPNDQRAAPAASARPQNKATSENPDPMKPKTNYSALGRIFAALTSASIAQAETAPSSSPEDRDEAAVMKLEPFETVMTKDKGYNSTNSAMALKTNEGIMEIPQSISIITRDMIEDVATTNTSDLLGYAGVAAPFQGESASLRGVRINYMVDGFEEINFTDSVAVDSIAILRGPAAVLYGLQASLGGLIMKNTRVPTGKRSTALTLRTDQWGFVRGEIDHAGTLGSFRDNKFSYRIDYAHQTGNMYFKRIKHNIDSFYVVLESRRPENLLRFNWSFNITDRYPYSTNFIAPDGVPYAGAGRKEDYQPNGMQVKRTDNAFRLIFNQKLAPGWDLAARGVVTTNAQDQAKAQIAALNYQTKEVTYSASRGLLEQQIYALSLDVTGKYQLFKRNHRTTFGLLLADNNNNPNGGGGGDPQFGAYNAANGVGRAVSASVLGVPMDNPMVDRITIRQADYYTNVYYPTTYLGSRQDRVTTNVYLQQNFEVIPNRLSLVGSLAQFNLTQTSETLTIPRVPNPSGSNTRQGKLLHRVGAVFNFTKDIVVYALDSETMAVQTSRLIDGSITPPQLGTGREIGLKTNLWDGRVTATVGFFNIKLTNVAFNPGGVSPITGLGYVTLIGRTEQKGADISLFVKPTRNWQVIINAYKGTVKDAFGNGRLPTTFTGNASIYTRYNFESEILNKFAIGGGAYRTYGRWSAANNITFADGSLAPTNGSPGGARVIKLKDGTMASLFVDYKVSRHLTLKLTVNNLFDEFFALGALNILQANPTVPRTFGMVATYRF